jgi:hypothetical protein
MNLFVTFLVHVNKPPIRAVRFTLNERIIKRKRKKDVGRQREREKVTRKMLDSREVSTVHIQIIYLFASVPRMFETVTKVKVE